MIFRIVFFLFVLVPFMLVVIPLQALILWLKLPFWNVLPRLFHRLGCVFLGLRVNVIGTASHGRGTLLVSNHISWTDIIAIGSVAHVTFVAKREVRSWPFVGMMANLQRTIYVDRTRRSDAGRTAQAMGRHMSGGNAVLLFAEGQSDIGTHVLPFRSALIGAAQHAMLDAGASEVLIQPLTIAYTRLQGLAVSRNERSLIAWIKSRSIRQNIAEILTGPVKDVTVAFGTPMSLNQGADRKAVTRAAEAQVRAMLVTLNRGGQLPAQR
ncbi:1-acyl-sn-glycerol-3-phosphate acyltransferase [Devosia subaequoris]|uniref:1-acyl-sn-glycerol-3-phosphate acyltransferase n=1 Tax=Devosia subaequoris TaxID=395930 RepID=A0A7W6NC23_9HYPH|nr:lysophospholipid acyltransferase family protein [Devosia subaequoris]MBB4052319.1 1-acyl-sn-glycerol-3-phosphate acyltransferase [Devosia subaequoris]MCP1209481.1 1-acyl-sn-glycerol-3-phosphate acyltransferase [Devosia subaequoris]